MNAIQHESKLDEQGPLFVRWIKLTGGPAVEIEDQFHQTWLKPEQALALLQWLETERFNLERLVKPKKGKK